MVERIKNTQLHRNHNAHKITDADIRSLVKKAGFQVTFSGSKPRHVIVKDPMTGKVVTSVYFANNDAGLSEAHGKLKFMLQPS